LQLLTNPRTFVLCVWNFRSRARGRKFYRTYAPGNKSSIELSPRERNGTFAPGSESSCYRLGLLQWPKYAYRRTGVMLSPNFLRMGPKVPGMERKFLGHSLLRSESSTGAIVPWSKSSWTFHSTGANVPGNESSTGTKVPCVDFSLQGTKVQRNEFTKSPDRKKGRGRQPNHSVLE